MVCDIICFPDGMWIYASVLGVLVVQPIHIIAHASRLLFSSKKLASFSDEISPLKVNEELLFIKAKKNCSSRKV